METLKTNTKYICFRHKSLFDAEHIFIKYYIKHSI